MAAFQGRTESELSVRAPVPGVYFFLGSQDEGRQLSRWEVVQSSLCQLSGVPLGVPSPKPTKEKECMGPLELQAAASSHGAPEASSDCVGSPGGSIPGEGDRTPVTVRRERPGAACWRLLGNGTRIA